MTKLLEQMRDKIGVLSPTDTAFRPARVPSRLFGELKVLLRFLGLPESPVE